MLSSHKPKSSGRRVVARNKAGTVLSSCIPASVVVGRNAGAGAGAGAVYETGRERQGASETGWIEGSGGAVDS